MAIPARFGSFGEDAPKGKEVGELGEADGREGKEECVKGKRGASFHLRRYHPKLHRGSNRFAGRRVRSTGFCWR